MYTPWFHPTVVWNMENGRWTTVEFPVDSWWSPGSQGISNVAPVHMSYTYFLEIHCSKPRGWSTFHPWNWKKPEGNHQRPSDFTNNIIVVFYGDSWTYMTTIRNLFDIFGESLKSVWNQNFEVRFFRVFHMDPCIMVDAVDVAAAVVPPQVKCSLVLPLTIIDCIENMHCHVHPDMKTIEN